MAEGYSWGILIPCYHVGQNDFIWIQEKKESKHSDKSADNMGVIIYRNRKVQGIWTGGMDRYALEEENIK